MINITNPGGTVTLNYNPSNASYRLLNSIFNLSAGNTSIIGDIRIAPNNNNQASTTTTRTVQQLSFNSNATYTGGLIDAGLYLGRHSYNQQTSPVAPDNGTNGSKGNRLQLTFNENSLISNGNVRGNYAFDTSSLNGRVTSIALATNTYKQTNSIDLSVRNAGGILEFVSSTSTNSSSTQNPTQNQTSTYNRAGGNSEQGYTTLNVSGNQIITTTTSNVAYISDFRGGNYALSIIGTSVLGDIMLNSTRKGTSAVIFASGAGSGNLNSESGNNRIADSKHYGGVIMTARYIQNLASEGATQGFWFVGANSHSFKSGAVNSGNAISNYGHNTSNGFGTVRFVNADNVDGALFNNYNRGFIITNRGNIYNLIGTSIINTINTSTTSNIYGQRSGQSGNAQIDINAAFDNRDSNRGVTNAFNLQQAISGDKPIALEVSKSSATSNITLDNRTTARLIFRGNGAHDLGGNQVISGGSNTQNPATGAIHYKNTDISKILVDSITSTNTAGNVNLSNISSFGGDAYILNAKVDYSGLTSATTPRSITVFYRGSGSISSAGSANLNTHLSDISTQFSTDSMGNPLNFGNANALDSNSLAQNVILDDSSNISSIASTHAPLTLVLVGRDSVSSGGQVGVNVNTALLANLSANDTVSLIDWGLVNITNSNLWGQAAINIGSGNHTTLIGNINFAFVGELNVGSNFTNAGDRSSYGRHIYGANTKSIIFNYNGNATNPNNATNYYGLASSGVITQGDANSEYAFKNIGTMNLNNVSCAGTGTTQNCTLSASYEVRNAQNQLVAQTATSQEASQIQQALFQNNIKFLVGDNASSNERNSTVSFMDTNILGTLNETNFKLNLFFNDNSQGLFVGASVGNTALEYVINENSSNDVASYFSGTISGNKQLRAVFVGPNSYQNLRITNTSADSQYEFYGVGNINLNSIVSGGISTGTYYIEGASSILSGTNTINTGATLYLGTNKENLTGANWTAGARTNATLTGAGLVEATIAPNSITNLSNLTGNANIINFNGGSHTVKIENANATLGFNGNSSNDILHLAGLSGGTLYGNLNFSNGSVLSILESNASILLSGTVSGTNTPLEIHIQDGGILDFALLDSSNAGSNAVNSNVRDIGSNYTQKTLLITDNDDNLTIENSTVNLAGNLNLNQTTNIFDVLNITTSNTSTITQNAITISQAIGSNQTSDYIYTGGTKHIVASIKVSGQGGSASNISESAFIGGNNILSIFDYETRLASEINSADSTKRDWFIELIRISGINEGVLVPLTVPLKRIEAFDSKILKTLPLLKFRFP